MSVCTVGMRYAEATNQAPNLAGHCVVVCVWLRVVTIGSGSEDSVV
jgi:hypothetical protein